MSRLVTLMSCQWADMDLDTLCRKASEWGYDGPLSVEWDKDFPDVNDGLCGVKFIEACVKSSAQGAAWVEL